MAEEKKIEEVKADKKINPDEEPVLFWEAPEFHIYEKGTTWSAGIIIGAIVLAGIFFWLKNWTGMALAVAAAAALLSQGYIKPKNVRCAIFDGGVVIGNKPYNFGELKSFWLFENPIPIIRFEKASRFAMAVTMPLGKTDPEQVRIFLRKRLPEHEERGEDISDRITRWLRF